MPFPERRLRRLRRTPTLRRLVSETRLSVDGLVAPLFVKEGVDGPEPIASMPGVVQHSHESLRKEVRELAGLGVPAVMLFGIPATKDARGSGADAPDGVVQTAVRNLRDEVGDAMVLMTDDCLDEYTDHGHCGLLTSDGTVDNDATLERYASIAFEPGGRGCRHRRTVGDDGRAGLGDPRCARRRWACRRGHPRLLGEVRVGVVRTVPRRGRVRAAVR